MKNFLDGLRTQSPGKKVLIGVTALAVATAGAIKLLRKKPEVVIEADGDVIIEVDVEETVVDES